MFAVHALDPQELSNTGGKLTILIDQGDFGKEDRQLWQPGTVSSQPIDLLPPISCINWRKKMSANFSAFLSQWAGQGSQVQNVWQATTQLQWEHRAPALKKGKQLLTATATVMFS